MKRFILLTLGAIALSTSFVPTSAEAGPLRRLFSRWFGGNAEVRYVETDSGAYRRYSYEPSTEPWRGDRMDRSREAQKPAWWYPKTDPRRDGSY